MERKPTPDKMCPTCGKKMERRRFNGRLEDLGAFNRRIYCDRACMAAGMMKDSPTSSALLKRATKHRGEKCEECGTTENLGIHHIDSNQANNNPSNLMTLCGSCHTSWHWANGKTMPAPKPCEVCGEPSRKLGMCQKHYQRFVKYGDPCLTKKRLGAYFVLVREAPGVPSGPMSHE